MYYKDLRDLCIKSKNLYNTALYVIRQHYFNKKNLQYTEDIAQDINYDYINYYSMNKLLKESNNECYRSLPANTSQEVLKSVDRSFKSFFELIKSSKKGEYNEKINIPKYKKNNQLYFIVYNRMTLSANLLKDNIIKLPKTNIQFKTLHGKQLTQVRFIPKNNYIVMEVIYEQQTVIKKIDNQRYISIDLGVNNLCTITNNISNRPIIINGRPIKSINQYYNKKRSKIQSELELKNKAKTSKRLNNLILKRNNKIYDYFHKVSKWIVNYAVSNSVNTIVIGKNNRWKQETNLGKVNNQNFVQIPFNILIHMIHYKSELNGINVILQEESYTSKVSFFNNDFIPEYNKTDNLYKPSGKRICRGLYKLSDGFIVNSDINGSLNILRKYLNVSAENIVGSRSLVTRPVKLKYI